MTIDKDGYFMLIKLPRQFAQNICNGTDGRDDTQLLEALRDIFRHELSMDPPRGWKESDKYAAEKLRECAREFTDLATHPETRVAGGYGRVNAFKFAANKLHKRASKLSPFRPRKFS